MKIKETNDGTNGGILKGKSHAEGGMKAVVITDNHRPIEVEGEEAIITKGTLKSEKIHTFDGKEMKPKEILSELNQEGGGVPILEKGGTPEQAIFYDENKIEQVNVIIQDNDHFDKQSKYYIAQAKYAGIISTLHQSKLFRLQDIKPGDYIFSWCMADNKFKLFKITSAKGKIIKGINIETEEEKMLSYAFIFDNHASLYSKKQIMQPGGNISPSLFDTEANKFKIFKDGGTIKESEDGFVEYNWENIPEYSKSVKTVRHLHPVKEISVKDKTYMLINKTFSANDEIRPVINAVYCDNTVIVATDSHKLISYPFKTPQRLKNRILSVEKNEYELADKTKEIYLLDKNGKTTEIYKTEKDGTSDIYFITKEKQIFLSEVEGKYPNYQAVFPSGEDSVTCKVNLYDIKAYINAVKYFVNQAYENIKFRFKNKNGETKYIGFNAKKLTDIINFCLSQGFTNMNMVLKGSNTASILIPENKNYNGYSDKFMQILLMPMTVEENDCQEEPDFKKRINAIYDFSDAKVLSEGKYYPVNPVFDKDISEFSQGNIPQNIIKTLSKAFKKSALPVLDYACVENNTLAVSDISETVEISNAGLSKGLYEFYNDCLYFYNDDTDDFPVKDKEGIKKIGTINISDLEIVVSYAKKLKLDKIGGYNTYPLQKIILFNHNDGVNVFMSDEKTVYIQKIRADIKFPKDEEVLNEWYTLAFDYKALGKAKDLFDYTRNTDVYLTEKDIFFVSRDITVSLSLQKTNYSHFLNTTLTTHKDKILVMPELAHNYGKRNFTKITEEISNILKSKASQPKEITKKIEYKKDNSENNNLKVGDIINYKNDYGKEKLSKIIEIESPERIVIETIDKNKIRLNPKKVSITKFDDDLPFEKGGKIGFKKLSEKVTNEYIKKGYTPEKAKEIGQKTAAKIYWKQQNKN